MGDRYSTDRTRHPNRSSQQASAKARRKKREKIIVVIAIILAVIFVCAAVLCVLYTRWVKQPVLPGSDVPQGESKPIQSEDLDEDSSSDGIQPKVAGERKSPAYYTILVFGEDLTSGNTDNIMVVSYDVTNQKAAAMSIPRDTLINTKWTSVTGKMINSVYPLNGRGDEGIQVLKAEVSELVGFVPDYYVKINWELVGQVVDAIGGVWFDVPWHMGYDDPKQDLHIHFEEGYQYLTGEDAMNFVRWRHNNDGKASPGGGGDVSRLGLQQDFLKAVLEQTLQLKNVMKIRELAELFEQNVDSDLSIENMYWFASQAILGGLNADSVTFTTMPYFVTTDDQFAHYWGRVYPNESELIPLVNEYLNPFMEEVTIQQLDLIRVSADGNRLSSSTGILADPSAGW